MRKQSPTKWSVPRALPVWVVDYEVWHGGQPYRAGTVRIPAETRETAQQAVNTVLHGLMPNLFPDAEIRLLGELLCEER